MRLLPNTSYEFKFKLGKQYLIDEKYPTVINKYGTQNNRIITYSDRIETPTGWRAKQSYSSQKISPAKVSNGKESQQTVNFHTKK